MPSILPILSGMPSLLLLHACSRPLTRSAEEGVEESVFHQAFIPRQLHDVVDFERVHDRMAVGGAEAHGVYYDTISGMVSEQPKADIKAQDQDGHSRQDAASASSDGSSSDGAMVTAATSKHISVSLADTAACSSKAVIAEQQRRTSVQPPNAAITAAGSDDNQCSVSTVEDSSSDSEAEHRIPVTVTREDRKTHKKAVKEAARERRKTKIPKHVKKRATKHK